MSEQWHFVNQEPNLKARDPIQGEFFASEAIEGPAEALVREGIQNAGDARRRKADGTPEGPARVRVYLSGEKGALSSARMARYTKGVWEHIAAPRSGLKEPPEREEACDFLVRLGEIEHPGTTPGRRAA